ncbi:TRAP transporter small permease [Salipiger sp. IMCC34102]|uniref:TRAP transporter small permease n=1 Tax=Salipiger sp. IMCC34102 TaxID=2510647 RepID=UPI00101D4639|nr:TRAP transporter small permease [Salipiger sp. IMCC34102]RYH03496.1 TRAP transporter small permease [Salipiger sp. IMCC34102]
MRDGILRLSAVISRLCTFILWGAAFGLVLMTALIGYQVWGRFVMNNTPTWTETTSVLLMGWFIFLGAAIGIREGNHLSFDVALFFMPDRAKQVCHTISDLVVIAFGAGMLWYGWTLAQTTWSSTIPNLGITGATAFMSLIFGGGLMVLLSVERLLRRAVGERTARFGEELED